MENKLNRLVIYINISKRKFKKKRPRQVLVWGRYNNVAELNRLMGSHNPSYK